MFDFFFSSFLGLIILFSIPLILVLIYLNWSDNKKENEEKSKQELEERVRQLEEKLKEKSKEN